MWGPPGTGKTTVIVRAVADALQHGRSVLISSHTHVAVDNVVKDLAETVSEPGEIVRVGGVEKVDPEVVDHPWLTLDKAAAALTDREARLKVILDEEQANNTHQDRQRLETVIIQLEFDISAVENALRAAESAQRSGCLEGAIENFEDRLARMATDIEHLATEVASASTIASELPAICRRHEQLTDSARQTADSIASANTSTVLAQDLAR